MSEGAGPPTPGTPADPPAALPDDPAILRQMVRELLDLLRQTRDENAQLQHRLELLLRRLYGPRTERFDPNQPLLIPDAFDAPAAAPPRDTSPVPGAPGADLTPARKKQRGHGRRALPEDLPRVQVVHELTAAECR